MSGTHYSAAEIEAAIRTVFASIAGIIESRERIRYLADKAKWRKEAS